jgi:hypothetical protein
LKVKYQIVVEVTADGLMGPLRVHELIAQSLTMDRNLKEKELEFGKIRVASVYPIATERDT